MKTARKIRDFLNSPLHRWQKGEDFLAQKFISQLKDDKQGRFFNDALLQRMEEESRRLKSLYNRLALINWAIFAVLLSGVFQIALQINLLGLTLKPDTVAREILIVVSANLGTVASAIYLHANILRTLAIRAREAATPEPYSLALIDKRTTAEFLSAAILALVHPGFGSRIRRWLSGGFIITAALFTLTQLLLYLAVGIAVHIAVMMDIWNKPSLPIAWSHVVVVYVLILDIMSVLFGLSMSVVSLRYRNSVILSEFVSRSSRSDTEGYLYLEALIEKASRRTTKN